jgi:hypothetical protein
MELTELQNIWQDYDKKLSENICLNKKVLRLMLQSKPERWVSRIKVKAVFNLILPIGLVFGIFIPGIEFRNEPGFYGGWLLFGPFAILTYYWAVRYYQLVCKIDFSKPVTEIRKDIKMVEKYKIKMKKFGYIFSPLAMTGVFLIARIPILSRDSFLPLTLIVVVLSVSVYYTFKYSISERFRKLNLEIEEIEALENE